MIIDFRRPRRGARPFCLAGALLLGACGGGSDDADPSPGGPDVDGGGGADAPGLGQLPEPEAPADASVIDGAREPVPEAVAVQGEEGDGAGLRLVVGEACGGAGDEIVARLFLTDGEASEGGEPGAGTNVTAYASFDQGLGDSAELVSRTDDEIRLRLTRPDIVAITATLEARTLTRYFGAWPDDAPAASALRKRAPAGCLWSLRLPAIEGRSDAYCASVYSRGAAGQLGQDVRRLDIDGCESTTEAGLPIIELPAVGAGGS